jgi:hypothetical protein
MLIIQYLILLIFFQISDLFINPLKYNGDKSLSFRLTNSYYSLKNSSSLSSSSLIDFMKTLYEQEKQNNNNKQIDYNLIRAIAPRIGRIIL